MEKEQEKRLFPLGKETLFETLYIRDLFVCLEDQIDLLKGAFDESVGPDRKPAHIAVTLRRVFVDDIAVALILVAEQSVHGVDGNIFVFHVFVLFVKTG